MIALKKPCRSAIPTFRRIPHGLELIECERRTTGATHAQIGAYLLGLWGLPYSIVEAVALHHAPLPSILCVDDEPRVLEGLALHLRRDYQVLTVP